MAISNSGSVGRGHPITEDADELAELKARLENLRWSNSCIDSYDPIDVVSDWWGGEFLECPKCDRKPRLWIFDNGKFAKCQCCEVYGQPMARSESITSVHMRTGNTAEYNLDDLRLAWNKYVETGEPQNKLAEGIW